MKNFLVVLFIALSPNLFAQTNEEITRQIIKEKMEGPFKALNGRWTLKYFTTAGQFFYKEKINEYVKMGFADAKRAAKEPISAEDSIKLCQKLAASLKNSLDISYSFTGTSYSSTKNGVWDMGYVDFSEDLTKITLLSEDGQGKKFNYKVEKADATELILVPLDGYGKELGKMLFTKQK